MNAAASIGERAAFDFIRYASVWEDADVLCRALEQVAPGARLLSVASAGDNALALLTLDPAEVTACDLSGAQLACLALRVEAFRRLGYRQLLRFLGVEPADDRLEAYGMLRLGLPSEARAFWDARPWIVASGIIHGGKFERFFRIFRRRILPLIHSRKTVEALCRPKSIEEQREFYDARWNTWRWRLVFRLFFSRVVMGRLGRDPEFFAEVEGSVGPRILERTRYALTEIPVATNPYFVYIMTGNYSPRALPRYLREEHHGAIRSRLERITLEQGSASSVRHRGYAGFNLSDIFEYMSRREFEECYAALLGRARGGARLVYWNMLVPRSRPEANRLQVRPLTELAEELHAQDRAWFYRGLRVDEVVAEEAAG